MLPERYRARLGRANARSLRVIFDTSPTWEPERAADFIALVRLEKLVDAFLPHVSFAVALLVVRMDLRVRPRVPDPLTSTVASVMISSPAVMRTRQ